MRSLCTFINLFFFQIQTRLGAAAQKDCVCDTSKITSDFPTYGNAEVIYDCRNLTIDGDATTIGGYYNNILYYKILPSTISTYRALIELHDSYMEIRYSNCRR